MIKKKQKIWNLTGKLKVQIFLNFLDIIRLECIDVLKNNDNFGPEYVTQQVNYMDFIVHCPHDCFATNIRGIGLGIHPEEASICISAIIDQGVSLYGGYFSISVTNGLDSYVGGKNMYN